MPTKCKSHKEFNDKAFPIRINSKNKSRGENFRVFMILRWQENFVFIEKS